MLAEIFPQPLRGVAASLRLLETLSALKIRCAARFTGAQTKPTTRARPSIEHTRPTPEAPPQIRSDVHHGLREWALCRTS